MQIPVKSGTFGRVVTQERIVRVAKGAVENVQNGTADDSQYMGPFDKIHDLYCNHVKSKLIKGVHGLASETARLDRELRKEEGQRNQGDLQAASKGIETNKKDLEELMPGRSLEFGYGGEGPRIDGESYLVYSDQSKLGRTGFPLYSPAGSDILQRALGEVPGVPTFRTAQDIERADLANIRIKGRVSCAGELYRVRFHGQEPILLTSRNDLRVKELQTKLSTLGIQVQAAHALNRLAAIRPIDTALTLPSILPDNDEGQIRTEAQLAVMAPWVLAGSTAATNLQRLSQFFERTVTVEKNELGVILTGLIRGIDFPDENRGKFSAAMARLETLQNMQIRRDALALNIKQIYRGLCDLGRRCESSSARSCMEERVTHFNTCFGEFVALPLAEARRGRFDELITSQLKFLADFSNEMLLECNNLLTDLPPGAPASLAMIGTQEVLKAVLSDHSSTRAQINDAMENLRAARG